MAATDDSRQLGAAGQRTDIRGAHLPVYVLHLGGHAIQGYVHVLGIVLQVQALPAPLRLAGLAGDAGPPAHTFVIILHARPGVSTRMAAAVQCSM